MLAVRRKVKAKGRIKFLKSSTKTIKLIRPTGVPLGTKWARKYFKETTHLKIITPNQKENEQGKVISIWEVTEKIKGNKAKKFKKNKKESKETKKATTPLKEKGIT